MKTILTLKTSSMFFIGSVNLYKGIPAQVDSEELSPSTIRIVNQAIASGRLESTEGLLEAPAKEAKVEDITVEETPVVSEPTPVKDVPAEETEVETETNVDEDEAPVVEAEVKAPVKKKTTTAKKKAE